VALQKIEAPRFWIVAGPNGSGKSTLYSETDIEGFGRSVWIINPDLLASRIRNQENMDLLGANIAALNRIQAWLEASIQAHQTVGVETVLSTGKYRAMVSEAKRLGFEIRLIYVMLQSPDMNVERVRIRVATGGHDVPEDKIRERRENSLAQLPWFLDQADMALIYDNSGAKPRLVGQKIENVLTLDPAVPLDLRRALNVGPPQRTG
jgi:predicted ABC-type ATPase